MIFDKYCEDIKPIFDYLESEKMKLKMERFAY